MPKLKQTQLSNAQLQRIKTALRLYERKREEVVITESTVTVRKTKRKLDEYERFDRFVKRSTSPFVDEEYRYRQWKQWSRKKPNGKVALPAALERLAQRINFMNGYDVYASYGYSVVFYAYVEGRDPRLMEEQIKAEDNEGELYISTTPRKMLRV